MRRLVERLWVMFLARLLMAAGFSLSFPFLALYLNKERGVPMSWIGTFLAFSVLAAATGNMAGGAISDRLGRRPVMLAGLLSRAAAVFALYRAVEASAPFLSIAALHVLSAACGSIFDPAASAWVADQLPEQERVRAYSVTRTGGNIGWAVGPALGGLAAGGGYAPLFLWTAAVCVAVAALVYLLVPEAGRCGEAARGPAIDLRALGDPRLLRLCLGVLLLGAVIAQLITPVSLYAVRFAGLSEREVGFLFSLNGGLVAVLQVGVSHAARGTRLTRLLASGALVYAAGYAAVGCVDGFWPMAAAVALVTAGEMIGAPAEPALAANLAPPGRRGSYIGVVGLAHQAGWALGPLAAGWLMEGAGRMRPNPYWLGVAAVAAASAPVFAGLRRAVSAAQDGQRSPAPEALEPGV